MTAHYGLKAKRAQKQSSRGNIVNTGEFSCVVEYLRCESGVSALDVEELLHADVGSEPSLGHAKPILLKTQSKKKGAKGSHECIFVALST